MEYINMEKENFNKIEIKKIWNAMKDAGIIEKSEDEERTKQQYNLKENLKEPGRTGQYLIKTVLFSLNKIKQLNEDFEEMDKTHEETIRDLEQRLHKACSQTASLTAKLKDKEYTIECKNKSQGELLKKYDKLQEQVGMNEPKPVYDLDSDSDESEIFE
tara:strand:- start:2919 stop:3395 length:477 start_codon:yes stop_codon:yes gene_type:complete